MAFDRSNPADLLALKTEVETDPIGMGYAPVVSQTNNLLRLLNDAENNVGGETALKQLDAEAMLDVIDTGDFASNQVDQGERDWIRMVFDYARSGFSIEKYRQRIRAVFQVNSQTVQNIDNLTRPLSRSEVLFGEGTVLTRDDWAAAR